MNQAINPALVPTRVLANGDTIPAMGMGTFGSDRFSPEEVSGAVAKALRKGYRLFDCAAIYGNEHLIGDVFAAAIEEGVVSRSDLYITSKVWNDQHHAVLASLHKSLADLQTDYVDAYFLHWPFPNYHAPFAQPDDRNPDSKPFSVSEFMDTWHQLEAAFDQGLVKHLGMSNMTIPKLEAVLPLCRIQPTLIEMELHPSFQQPELFTYCLEKKIQPIAFCPIGSPSRPDRDKTAADVVDTEIPELVALAEKYNVHPAIICLKWAVQRGQIPIPFSVVEEQFMGNLRATIDAPLTAEEMATLATVDQNCRLIKGQVFLWEEATSWEDLWDVNGHITN